MSWHHFSQQFLNAIVAMTSVASLWPYLALVISTSLIAASACSSTVSKASQIDELNEQPELADVPLIIEPSRSTQQALPSGSGIEGRVILWPLCPAQPQGSACPTQPVTAIVEVFPRSGERIASAVAGDDGWFQVAVSPGDYVIKARAEGVMCAPVDVTVTSNQYVQVTINCDTGVR